ncbi:flagellar hook-basal body protein [Bacillus kwashiorkori]|uniref:flagellar hook-basal body protein n=1 Tax=Bacillus kwashiorkori TaxID=1522318 RepID=UPI0007851DC1|nr:flagellar hook-basal body protein [Bacillus kwashiorkori]
MFRGFYTAASGMLAQQRRTEMLTNNLANMNTPGFKADESSLRAFPELLLSRLDGQQPIANRKLPQPMASLVGGLNTGVYVQDIAPLFHQGDLQQTELSTDIALVDLNIPTTNEGSPSTVLFTVEGPNGGVQYTRNGNFTLDGAGYLTMANGQYVLSADGNRIQLTNDEFIVDNDGWINQNGATVARLGVAYAENPLLLAKRDNGTYELDNGTLPSAYDNENIAFQTKQGYIERSNVDPQKAMTELLTAYRSFEANQKVLQAYDRSMDKAVNEVGRL